MTMIGITMLLANVSMGKSFVRSPECVKLWLTDEHQTESNMFLRRLSDGLFAIGRKRFVKTLKSFTLTISGNFSRGMSK